MAQLERTIRQILENRRHTSERRRRDSEENADRERIEKRYAQEFESAYAGVDQISLIHKEFIAWANRQEISDADGRVKDGAAFFQILLQDAKRMYNSLRDAGYEPRTAFDKSTEDLGDWIARSVEQGPKGTIYVNYPRETLRRLRKMAEW